MRIIAVALLVAFFMAPVGNAEQKLASHGNIVSCMDMADQFFEGEAEEDFIQKREKICGKAGTPRTELCYRAFRSKFLANWLMGYSDCREMYRHSKGENNAER